MTELLGLEGFVIKSFQEKTDCFLIGVVSTNTSSPCPHCGQPSSRIHDYRQQSVKHTVMRDKVVILNVRKKRFTCPSCNKHHYETLSFVQRYQRTTSVFVRSIIKRLSEVRSVKSIAEEFGISSPTVTRIFSRFKISRRTMPAVLCIDEFKGNAGGEKYQCSLVDGENKLIIDILKSREKAFLEQYFSSLSEKEKSNVKYVVSDMYDTYLSLARIHFPNAIHIADKFHFARQCFWAFENVRIRCQRTMNPVLRKYYKRSKSIMRKRRKKLTPDETEALIVMLNYHDDLRQAYYLKDRFYLFLDASDYLSAKYYLEKWVEEAQTFALPEFKDCVRALTNWKQSILNYYTTGYTNARIEGFNNKIKVIKRTAYGFRNFDNFRKRIMFCCG